MKNQQKPRRRYSAADRTRAKILHAAQQLFAQKGFSGTSISQIAKKAHVNQSLIFHHFGNKQNLWKQVKITLLQPYFSAQEIAKLANKLTLGDFIRAIAQQRFTFYEKNPDAVRLISWQKLEPKSLRLQGTPIDNKTTLEAWREALISFQKRRELRADLNPDFIVIFLNNLCIVCLP